MDSRITLISVVARLLDLHQTQHPRGTPVTVIIAPKQPPPSAGFFLSLGLTIVDALHNLELERGPGFQSKSRVFEHVKIKLPEATDTDLEFCIRFLSLNREVHYLVENEKNEEVNTRITDTALIEKAGEFSQIRLTETARLLLRIDAAQESWLYKDKDVEKIAVAVERGHFQDISRFCREIIISLSGLGLRLTHLEERPTMVEKRREFAGLRLYYGETISRAQQAIAKAIGLTAMEPVRERFKAWAEQNGIEDADMGFILSDLEHVARTIETVNRKLMKFVQNVQGIAASTAGIIKFQDLAYNLAITPSDNSLQQIGDLMPQPIRRGLFHPFDFVGSVELETSLSEQDIIPYVIGDEPRHARQHLTSFMDRHISSIVRMLQKGPISFGTLIQRLGFTLEPGETLADFVGIYTFTENNETHVIKIGLDDSRFETRMDHVVIHGNNAMLTLMQERIA